MQTQKNRRICTIDIKQFSENLKRNAAQATTDQSPLKVTQGNGKYFVVLSADEWEREQETIQVLQDTDLMRQIAKSLGARAGKTAKKRPSTSRRADE